MRVAGFLCTLLAVAVVSVTALPKVSDKLSGKFKYL